MNDFKDDYNLYSNKKFKINEEEFKNNLKSKTNIKTKFMLRNAKLKYDNELEIDFIDEKENKKSKNNETEIEIEKELQEENRLKLRDIQIKNTFYIFDKNLLTSFNNEKYEYLLPHYLEAKEDNEESINNRDKMDSYLRKDDNGLNSKSNSSEKNDISRAERFTSSNKKKLSLGNFDSNNLLMNNLSRLSLDKNDFKGAKSFIEKIADIEKENKISNENDVNRDENNINLNSNLNVDDINNDFIEQDDDMNINNNINVNKGNKLSDDLIEEEDAKLLKDDLEKNVFGKSKKKITFDKIREKLENKDKFEEPKLFYDLLLLAQKGDIDISQRDLMKNKSINISLNY